jgi:hypothetical protein
MSSRANKLQFIEFTCHDRYPQNTVEKKEKKKENIMYDPLDVLKHQGW